LACASLSSSMRARALFSVSSRSLILVAFNRGIGGRLPARISGYTDPAAGAIDPRRVVIHRARNKPASLRLLVFHHLSHQPSPPAPKLKITRAASLRRVERIRSARHRLSTGRAGTRHAHGSTTGQKTRRCRTSSAKCPHPTSNRRAFSPWMEVDAISFRRRDCCVCSRGGF
jgi:hypothetical protein